MVKTKITEKKRLFYRGPPCKPTLVADEDEMQLVLKVLSACIPLKGYDFEIESNHYKMTIGLSSGLRNLKSGKSKLIIYDDTADQHLANYLNHFASQSKIPIIQANNLIKIAPELKLKTLLMVSFIESPKSVDKEFIFRGDSLTDLFKLVQSKMTEGKLQYKKPVLDAKKCNVKSENNAKKRIKKTRPIAEKRDCPVEHVQSN